MQASHDFKLGKAGFYGRAVPRLKATPAQPTCAGADRR
jgi:hypothetical protein